VEIINMARVRKDINTDYVINEHLVGKRKIMDIAREFNVTHKVIKNMIIGAGFSPLTKPTDFINNFAVIGFFNNGKSINAISKIMGVSRGLINTVLVKNGHILRSRSEAEKLRWSQMTETQRKRQILKAHQAVKGRCHSTSEKLRRAKTNYRKQNKIYPREILFNNMLKARGIKAFHQFQVGIYNCDLASKSVIVEIVTSNGTFKSPRFLKEPKRIRYLLNRGYIVIYVFCDRAGMIGDGAADYVASYIKCLGGGKSIISEYRMIGSTGKLIARGSLDSDDSAFIESLKCAKDIARTKSHRVT
jgi:hypothetical protein